MARIKITRNGQDDPTYFQLQEWVETLTPKFGNRTYLETQNGEDPISIEVVDDMMSTNDYVDIADTLLKNGRYQYWVEN
jgi:hypothetical protein